MWQNGSPRAELRGGNEELDPLPLPSRDPGAGPRGPLCPAGGYAASQRVMTAQSLVPAIWATSHGSTWGCR